MNNWQLLTLTSGPFDHTTDFFADSCGSIGNFIDICVRPDGQHERLYGRWEEQEAPRITAPPGLDLFFNKRRSAGRPQNF